MRDAVRQLIEANARLELSKGPKEILYISDQLVDYFLKGYVSICYYPPRYELFFSVSPTLKELPFDIRAFFQIADKHNRYTLHSWEDLIKDLPGMWKK
jgi:hypothetical protein